jgi:RES domain-containing protein
MRIWRISNYVSLAGTGGILGANRWNIKGIPMVYCADHPSTALLETIVHMTHNILAPDNYQLLAIDAPDTFEVIEPILPANWQAKVQTTRLIGTTFARENKVPLMRIPSVIMPQAFNYLLNPSHPDATSFRIAQSWRYPFDSRLLT